MRAAAANTRVSIQLRRSPLFAFVLYALAVWYLAACFRRRVGGFLWVGAGLLGVALTGYFHYWLNIVTKGVIALPVLQSLLWPYALLVGGVGLYIALLPRRARPCVACGFDLDTLAFRSATCPNCHHARSLRCLGAKCGQCAYDLAGQDLNHGICPECGTPFHGRKLPDLRHEPDVVVSASESSRGIEAGRRRELLADLSSGAAVTAPKPRQPS